MTNKLVIEAASKKDFEGYFEIMKEAFPPAEYRPKEKQYAILEDPDYTVTLARLDGEICGFIAAWRLDGFLFIEHLAVSSGLRGRGVGSLFVKEYKSSAILPLVLEVENLQDDVSLRRIEFYKRLGFTLSDICYDQPNFQKYEKTIPLRIMYCENEHPLDVAKLKDEIFKKVYKKNDRENNL